VPEKRERKVRWLSIWPPQEGGGEEIIEGEGKEDLLPTAGLAALEKGKKRKEVEKRKERGKRGRRRGCLGICPPRAKKREGERWA